MPLDSTLKALADPIRRQILTLLRKEPLSASEIAHHFSISHPAISRHLSILKQADLIQDTRKGKYIYYALNTSVLEEAIAWLYSIKDPKETETSYENAHDPLV